MQAQFGTLISKDEELEKKNGFAFDERILKLRKNWKEQYIGENKDNDAEHIDNLQKDNQLSVESKDLYQLGILEYDNLNDKDLYPVIGKGHC